MSDEKIIALMIVEVRSAYVVGWGNICILLGNISVIVYIHRKQC